MFSPTHAFDLADADLDPPAVPATPVSGDIDTVRCTGWLPGLADDGLPRLGRALRVGPRRPRPQRLGGADGRLGRPPVGRTTSTSSRPGPTPGCCRSSSTGTRLTRASRSEQSFSKNAWRRGCRCSARCGGSRPARTSRSPRSRVPLVSSRTTRVAELGGDLLEVAQQPGAEPGAAPVRVHPHPLDLADAGASRWTPPHATGTPSLVATTKRPRAGRHRSSSWSPAGVEPGGEAPVELGEVVRHRGSRPPGRPGRRAEVDGRGPDQQVGGGQRLGEPLALPLGQRRDQALRRAPRTGRPAGGGGARPCG